MFKLIALYSTPDDPQAFDRHYADVHLPLVQKIPGLLRTMVNRGIDAPWGKPPAYYQIVEMHFDNRGSFERAMASPENAQAGKDLRNFAAGKVTLMAAEEQ